MSREARRRRGNNSNTHSLTRLHTQTNAQAHKTLARFPNKNIDPCFDDDDDNSTFARARSRYKNITLGRVQHTHTQETRNIFSRGGFFRNEKPHPQYLSLSLFSRSRFLRSLSVCSIYARAQCFESTLPSSSPVSSSSSICVSKQHVPQADRQLNCSLTHETARHNCKHTFALTIQSIHIHLLKPPYISQYLSR